MYGGAMVTGSSSDPLLQGNNFARNGVIYVSFNTRESLWASPNSAELEGTGESQNFSILDVEKALEWIHENIAGTWMTAKPLSRGKRCEQRNSPTNTLRSIRR